MTRTTFAQVRAAFVTDGLVESFTCIANPHNRNDCANDLWSEQIEDAERLFRRAESGLTLDELRDIINCLLCVDCQRTYTHKDKVECKWSREFPEFDFSRRRSPSPYTLRSGRRKERQSSTTTRSLSSTPNNSPSRGRSSPSYLGTPPPQPVFTSANPARISTAPGPASISSRTACCSPTATVHDLNDKDQQRSLESPSNWQTEKNPRDCNAGASAPLEDASTPVLLLDDVLMSGALGDEDYHNDVPLIDYIHTSLSNAVIHETPNSLQDMQSFCPGEASNFAPWTIRYEVLSTLLEPIPKPATKGVIYAVQVKHTPYVKIGYTTRKLKDRLSEIAKQHKQNMDMNAYFRLDGIPYLQLLRLEALVHADLAYFQRNLRVSNGRSHREYFEVSLATAERCIKMWWRVMQQIRLEPGREVDNDICEAIQANPALNIETSDDQVSPIPQESWPEVNSNHELRQSVWRRVFHLEDEAMEKSHRSKLNGTLFPLVFGWMLFAVYVLPGPLTSFALLGLPFMSIGWLVW